MAEELTVRAVDRALELLEQFGPDQPALGVSDLARMTGLNKGTVYRLLNTLQQRGYVQQDPETQKYRLGVTLFRLGALAQLDMDVRRIALPYMRELRDKSQETVNLNVVSGFNRVCVECIETPHSVRYLIYTGYTGPLHRGASGKAMLAFLPESYQEAVMLGLLPEERIKLRKDLEQIRRQGYAWTRGDRLPDAASVSAPILGHEGTTVAGLTISGPRTRFTDDVIERCRVLVTAAAKEISIHMGFGAPR